MLCLIAALFAGLGGRQTWRVKSPNQSGAYSVGIRPRYEVKGRAFVFATGSGGSHVSALLITPIDRLLWLLCLSY